MRADERPDEHEVGSAVPSPPQPKDEANCPIPMSTKDLILKTHGMSNEDMLRGYKKVE